MNSKNIIWDWNGTLLNDRELCVDIINRILSRYDLPECSLQRYLEIFTFPIRNYYNRLGFHQEVVAFEKVADEFIEHYENEKFQSKLRPDAIQTLQAFQQMGYDQYILSASKQDSLDEIIDGHELRKYFSGIYGLRDHYAGGKEDIGRELMNENGLTADTSLFIGDTTHDSEVAQILEIPCLLVEGGHNSRERLNRCGCRLFRGLRFIPAFYRF